MATPAQMLANRANAQHSTGPRTNAGKAAVAKNRLSHGLNSDTLLPHEDAADFQSLADSLIAEWSPETSTETFLIEEMTHAQWKLTRVRHIEREILKSDDSNPTWAAIAEKFVDGSTADNALGKLNRYENSARRAWYKALNQLRALRNDETVYREDVARAAARQTQTFINRFIEAPLPEKDCKPVFSVPDPDGDSPVYGTKPTFANMPKPLWDEWQAHTKRDPLFHPVHDASQMSKGLRKWFETNLGQNAQAA